MTKLNLGGDPLDLGVTLSDQTDFVCELVYEVDGVVADWPVGTSLSLVFADTAATSWAATVTGSVARFDVDKAETANIAASTPVRLQYANGATDRALAVGRVKRSG